MDDFIKWLVAGLLIGAMLIVVFSGEFITLLTGESQSKDTVVNASNLALIGPENVETWKRIDLPDFSSSKLSTAKTYNMPDTWLYSGLLFGSNMLSYSLKAEPDNVKSASLFVTVTNTNQYGPLTVRLNGRDVYSAYPGLGEIEIPVDPKAFRPDNRLELLVGSSSWRMWARALYDLKDIRLVVNEYYAKSQRTAFDLYTEEYNRMTAAKLNFLFTKNKGELIIKINDNDISSSHLESAPSLEFDKSYLRLGENILDLSTTNNSDYEGKPYLMIFYRSDREHTLEKPFTVSNANRKGKISFTIARIVSDGKFFVKIIDAKGREHQIARESVAAKQFSYEFDSADIKSGENKVIIESDGKAIFYIKDLVVQC